MPYKSSEGFPYYYELVKTKSLPDAFHESATLVALQNLSEQKAAYRYKADKWSIKQVVGHIADHERIKMFRAFQLSRNLQIELWGYDQEWLVKNSQFDKLTLQALLQDFANVRKSSVSFIQSLSRRQLDIKGKARHYEISLEEFLISIVGHEIHHVNILQEKYNLV